MTATVIRTARAADLPRLAALEHACFDTPWRQAALAEVLADAQCLALVAALAGAEPVGFALFLRAHDEAELLRVAVLPERRRQGLAAALVRAGLARLESQGVRRWFLEVRPSNQAARGLYERLGFALAGRRRAYYSDGEDALVYAREAARGG